LRSNVQARALGTTNQENEDLLSQPGKVVRGLYDLVTFPKDGAPDWAQVKSLFVEQAVIVLRTGPDQMSIFTVDGFVQDFVSFIERSRVRETGFEERILRMDSTVYGDIATILVLFQARIPGGARPPQQGIDIFQLIRRRGQWRIVSITNERVDPEQPLPKELQK
jgi:hypothetical protein